MIDDRSEYLDPEKNPMIYTPAPEIDLEKSSPFDDLGLAPLMILNPSPEKIAEKLTATFPGVSEIKINDSLTLTRSASGGFMSALGYGLADLPAEDLIKIGVFLTASGAKYLTEISDPEKNPFVKA